MITYNFDKAEAQAKEYWDTLHGYVPGTQVADFKDLYYIDMPDGWVVFYQVIQGRQIYRSYATVFEALKDSMLKRGQVMERLSWLWRFRLINED